MEQEDDDGLDDDEDDNDDGDSGQYFNSYGVTKITPSTESAIADRQYR